MRLLITGGAGFIGSNLARRALGAGHDVVVVDDLSTGYRENLIDLDAELVEASIVESARLARAMSGIDSVIHLAALGSVPRSIKDPFATHAANITGTLSVLESARSAGVDHVIISSSSSIYGMNPALPKSEREWVRPMSPYAVTKLAAEQYTLAYQQSYGIATMAFRLFNVFGPGQRAGHVYAAVIPTFFDSLLRGDPLWINGNGSNSRDFTFVGTACDVLLAAAERKATHLEPVNLAFGTNTNLVELVSAIESVSGIRADLRFREPRLGDVPHSQADNSSLRELFPEVRPVLLEEGLRQTFDWFKGLA